MIYDKNLTFCTNQSHNGNATVQFTDTLDMQVVSDIADGGRSHGNDLSLHIHITTAFAGGLSGQFQLFACASTSINVIVDPRDQLLASASYAVGDLGLNTHLFLPLAKVATKSGGAPGHRPVTSVVGRYLIGQFIPGGTMTAGAFTARLAVGPTIGAFAYPKAAIPT